MLTSRNWWSHRLTHDLTVEVCGLIEILSTTRAGSTTRQCLTEFVHRICTLGSPGLPQMLAVSAADTLLEVFHAAGAEITGEAAAAATGDGQHQEVLDSAASTANFDLPGTIKTLTAGTKLVLGAQQPPNLPDQPLAPSKPPSSDEVIAFSSLPDASEVVHALSLFQFIIQQPICKQVFIEILRKDASTSA